MDPLTMMLISQGVSTGVGAIAGISQMAKAQSELSKLKMQKTPSVLEAKGPLMENIKLSRSQFERGLDPTSLRLARQQTATENLRNQRYFQDISGGQLSQAASRMSALGTAQSGLGLASMDVAARQRGMSALMSANQMYSGLLREDAAQRRQYRMMLEQQLGYAKSEGRQNIMNAIEGAAKGVTNYAMADAGFFGGSYGQGGSSTS